MAQIIQFPTGETVKAVPVPVRAAEPIQGQHITVVPIRGRRVPRKNRPEDDYTAMIARIASSWTARAEKLAQSEPGSDSHRLAIHMGGISQKLPRNNLRIFTTPDDLVEGVWRLWRRVKLADLEYEICHERRMDACHDDDDARRSHWSAEQDKADRRRWDIYERLVRVPAATLHDFNTYKLDRRFQGGMGNLEWMRQWKPELAAILDEEVARLQSEKAARKAARVERRGLAQ